MPSFPCRPSYGQLPQWLSEPYDVQISYTGRCGPSKMWLWQGYSRNHHTCHACSCWIICSWQITHTGVGNESVDSGDLSSSVSETESPIVNVSMPLEDTSLLHVPHLYWRCSTSGQNNDFPVIFNTLIDHGSSAVLISEHHATQLRLCHKQLHEPYSAELAMKNNRQKVEIRFSEYVKLQLHNLSSFWSLKSVCTIIAPSLCAPMILGLPFLTQNNIVVDAAARTVIDKKCNFDLLHQ